MIGRTSSGTLMVLFGTYVVYIRIQGPRSLQLGGSVTRKRTRWDRRGVRIADLTSCYEKNADALVRFATTMVGSDDADDVVSDAIVGVLRSSPDHIDDMTSYLYRSVANAAKKHWRSLSRRERRERVTA